ncbi:MAG TPA: lipopolysaccharide biosynthesis protein RfbH, partial [Bacteroidia bacterium]|nr:lipopolysaccharide biosynthesis protein RfbH [Bacteroidia bacterium]
MELTIDNINKRIDKATNRSIIPGKDYIPVTGKIIDRDDIICGIDATLDGWLTAGRFANEFERDFANY